MINKVIIHPGNGVNFPQKGDYIKIFLVVCGRSGTVIFNTADLKNNFIEVRHLCPENSLIYDLENLIGEMSLFEKCSLELDVNNILEESQIESETLKQLLNFHGKLTFEMEILNISEFPH